ncbi:MAG: carotenoid biosynthesis protein [Candidatus Korarchaeota archaeon]|nr:carotenoid biosynthesis protein [Candidatus Korarchaeota archaeon]
MSLKGSGPALIALSLGYILNAVFTLAGAGRESDLLMTAFFLVSVILSLRVWRGAWILPLSGSLVGYISEYLGVKYGFPFGHYEYEAFKGAALLNVPIPIVVAWGMYLYTCYLAASPYASGIRRLVLSAFLMVILDLAVDPVMVELGIWRWERMGPWFGVPTSNFVGWFLTSLIALLVYRSLAAQRDLKREDIMEWSFIPYLASFLPILGIAGPSSRVPAVASMSLALMILSILAYIRDLD